MPEKLPLLPPEPQPVGGAERFAECRQRVADGCGGHHEPGPLMAGLPIIAWLCCDDCPNRAEVHSPQAGPSDA